MNVEEIVDVCSVIKIVKDDFVDAVEYIIWCVMNNTTVFSGDGQVISPVVMTRTVRLSVTALHVINT